MDALVKLAIFLVYPFVACAALLALVTVFFVVWLLIPMFRVHGGRLDL